MTKYVFFGRSDFQYNGFDSMKILLNDIINDEDVFYIEPDDNWGFKYLNFWKEKRAFRKIDKLFGTPFRSAAYSRYVNTTKHLKKNDKIIFIFFRYESWFMYKNGFLEFLRKKYPNMKCVYYLLNVNKYLGINFEEFRNFYDAIFTVDEVDAKKYNLIYHPMFYSAIDTADDVTFKSDCLYVGNVKNRMDKIISIFERLNNLGLKTDFYLTGAEGKELKYPDLIHYSDPLNYDRIIELIKGTRIIIELLQEGQDAPTLRALESVAYGKKLITTCKSVVNQSYYDKRFMKVIDNPEEIDALFVSDNKEQVIYKSRDSISPRVFKETLSKFFQ